MAEKTVPLKDQLIGETESFELDENVDFDDILKNEAIDAEFLVTDEDIAGDSDINDLDDEDIVDEDEGDVEEVPDDSIETGN